jgi:5,10-methylenetetrahydrofolate reductase
MFFDVEVYIQFVADCRAAGIGCPIVPGIMLISKYPGFKRMTTMCKVRRARRGRAQLAERYSPGPALRKRTVVQTRVPPHIMAHADSIKDDAAAVAAYGVELATEMSTRLLTVGAPVLHYYSLNMDNPTVAPPGASLLAWSAQGARLRVPTQWPAGAGTDTLARKIGGGRRAGDEAPGQRPIGALLNSS